MSKTKVLLRADGSANIGFGHVYRMFSIANMLKNEFDCTFITHCVDSFIKELFAPLNIPIVAVSEINYPLVNTKKPHDEVAFDMQELINQYSIIVLDGYWFGKQFQSEIKKTGKKLVCIDDTYETHFLADLIINHSPGININNYSAETTTQFALGTDFALLRPAFLNAANTQRTISQINSLFICFGGSDINNLTKTALTIALQSGKFKKIYVVTGNAYKHTDINNLIAESSCIEHYHAIDEKQMLDIMLKADVAIVPSSGILLESIAAGCIAISGMSSDNQKFIYQNYLAKGLIIDAKQFTESDLLGAINSINAAITAQTKAIDGKSGERIVKLFKGIENNITLHLRKATLNDLEITYKWASDSRIRAFSFNTKAISFTEHQNWFSGKIINPNCAYYIAELNNNAVGSIRFDINNDEAVISYLIDFEQQGKNLGQHILSQGVLLLGKTHSFNKIIGYVMKKNIPSVKAFERLGFKKEVESDNYKFEITRI